MAGSMGELPGVAGIPNRTICDWFFALFVLNCIGAVLMVLSLGLLLKLLKGGGVAKTFLVLGKFVQIAIVLVTSAFLYTMCNRSLA